MEACNAVEGDVDKVLAKLVGVRTTHQDNVDGALNTLLGLQSELVKQSAAGNTAVSPAVRELLKSTVKKAKECGPRLSSQHKEIHAGISKVGRTIDKSFTQDFNVINCPEALEGKHKKLKLSHAVVEHLFRNGLLDAGKILSEEAHLDVKEHQAKPFIDMNNILNSLDYHDTGPALEWAIAHRAELEQRHSFLEYKLHRLRFIQLLKKSPEDTQAILECSKNFQRFRSPEQTKDFQKLMGALLFLKKGIDRSPYQTIFNEDLWVPIKNDFTKDACALLGLSTESPLTICINVGCKAIPMLLNIRAAMMQHHVGEIWNCSKTELPIEIDVSPDYLYHSKFACPILRQQSTDKNPPMRLICGHVISRDALTRLSTSQKSTKIKCPYCPSEQPAADAKVLYL